jgi:hypothetical protein
MKRKSTVILGIAVAISLASVVTWQATGGDYYTKYEVVEQVETAVDSDDPLASTGFYETDAQTETVTRSEFRFGLLPTPSGVFDKHLLSVVSVNGPVWILAIVAMICVYRREVTAARAT